MKAILCALHGTCVVALAVGVVSAAQAQNAPQSAQRAPDATQGQAADSNAGEIVVTANKREENLNKVGLTITAIGAEAIAERRITSVQDVAAAVPGLKFADSGTGTPIYTLRGIGFNEESLGVYPAVSVYTDEVPLPFPVLTLHAAFDLEDRKSVV